MHQRPTASITDFDIAAAVCGHDTSTTVGAENARHDRRLWDLLDGLIDDTLTESIAFLAAVQR